MFSCFNWKRVRQRWRMQSAFDCLSDIENARHSKRPGGGKKREPGSPVASRTPFDRLRVLLEHHKLPDVAIDQYRDSEGKTLLIAAAAAGHEEVVEYLLKRGASPNETDDKGWTALMCSVAFCKPKVCMILLSEPDIDVNISHGGGGTALFLAAHSGLGDVVNRLIELGADIHKSNIAGFTPVMMAVDGGNPDIAKVLIDAGAVVDNTDNLIGITALHLSVYIGDDASAEKILVHLSGDTGQKMTCINRRTKFGLSALHRAVASGHLTTARLLLEHGADPNVAEGKKRNVSMLKSLTRTAYAHKAVETQQPGIQSLVASLLLNRSPHDAMDTLGEGATPLHYAAKSGDTPMIKLLLAAGADPRRRVKKSKQSAVDFAIKHDRGAAIKAFEEHYQS